MTYRRHMSRFVSKLRRRAGRRPRLAMPGERRGAPTAAGPRAASVVPFGEPVPASPARAIDTIARTARLAHPSTRMRFRLALAGGAWVCELCAAVIFRPDSGGISTELAAHHNWHLTRGDLR